MAHYKTNADIELLQYDILQEHKLFHFTTTTHGGVSEGAYNSLNLSYFAGDSPENVSENRGRLAQAANVKPQHLFVPYQTHHDKICVVDKAFVEASGKQQTELLNGVDALITNQQGIGIGITTADCVPLLIFDPANRVLAAVHAGWKGTVARIAAKTANRMYQQFGSSLTQLLVAIGPCISPLRFEVGNEVGQSFAANGFDLSTIAYRNPETNKLHINLWEANRLQMTEIGIPNANIEIAKICTVYNPNRFFSARRQGIQSGRMVTGGIIR